MTPSKAWTRTRGTLFVTLAVFAALAATQAGRAGGHDDDDGNITFVSDRSGNQDIWAMAPDGSSPTRLTSDPASETFPAYSPNGKHIAFVRGSGFAREIYVMRADGSDVRRVTSNLVADVQPDWSPDGKRLVFVRFGLDRNRDIWTMRADGSDELQLTADPAPFDILPDWSPKGHRIVFESDRSGAVAVYTMRTDGTDVRKLTPDSLQGGGPAWSPNGRRIAFYDNFCDTCPLGGDVLVMDADGSDIRKLAELGERVPVEDGPSWSADGEALAVGAFDGFDFARLDIFVVDLERGGAITNVTASAGPEVVDIHADWGSPKDG